METPVEENLAPFTRDATQREGVVLEPLSHVRHIARRIHCRLPPQVLLEDLVHAGIVGLLDAVAKYDPTKNVKLKAYAEFRIRGAILDLGLRDAGSRVPLQQRVREIRPLAALAQQRELCIALDRHLVLDKIGIRSASDRMEAWGFPNTKINAKVFRGSTTSVSPERTKRFGLGSTTARCASGRHRSRTGTRTPGRFPRAGSVASPRASRPAPSPSPRM